MRHPALPGDPPRNTLVEWYRLGRDRSRRLFEVPVEAAYHDRPIPLRNPIVFYDGHMPAFAVNTLIKLALKKAGIDEQYETLFARGIDPDTGTTAASASDLWPAREAVASYGRTADHMIEEALAGAVLERPDVPQLAGAEAVFTILEHELMHHETLLYMFHEMPYDRKQPIAPLNAFEPPPAVDGEAEFTNDLVAVPAGRATLGASREAAGFGWDNEFPSVAVEVDEFQIQRYDVTNGEFMKFMKSGGYRDASLWSAGAWKWVATSGVSHPRFWLERNGSWWWRGMFELRPLDARGPVYVSHAEAAAYARWRGTRLPTEAEYHRAAFGGPSGDERQHPWGDEPPDSTRGNFDFIAWDPVPVGSFPAGASAWGIHDLVGNGWEWTSTAFSGFPGFRPMASYSVYSADFFDGDHYVLKGASPVTARQLIRRSFRNWFRATYPYMYATFRCAK